MSRTPRIVLLNGVGSAGKTSIAKAMQSLLAEPYLLVQMDTFMDMLPDRYQDHPEGFSYEPARDNGKPVVAVRTGPVGERVLRGMRHAVLAMAQQGNNLIVDEVLLGADEKREYFELLSAFAFHTVGIKASLDVLETRELQRKDRLIGLARWEYDKVHDGMTYDLEVDTGTASPLECARLICEKLSL